MTDESSKQRSIEQYGKVGDAYVRSETHAKGADLERILTIAAPRSEWFVLDVATGGGHTAILFAPHVDKVIATDVTPNMLQTAKTFIREEKGITNVEFELADAENLPFKNSSFDLTTCRIAPHHFPDCQKFLNESARVLKENGVLVIQDHVLPDDKQTAHYVDSFERIRDPSHNRAYSEKEWRAMFEKAGFSIEHTEQLTKRHEFLKWGKRMNNSIETLQELIQMVKNGSSAVVEWMQPLPDAGSFDAPEASFVNHQIIIAGRKRI